jgi:hypothetical protein
MKDMAKVMGVSVAFLSAIEVGTKSVPMSKVELIVKHYDLGAAEASQLRTLAAKSKDEVRIKVKQDSRELVTAFARRVDGLNKSDREAILSILSKE